MAGRFWLESQTKVWYVCHNYCCHFSVVYIFSQGRTRRQTFIISWNCLCLSQMNYTFGKMVCVPSRYRLDRYLYCHSTVLTDILLGPFSGYTGVQTVNCQLCRVEWYCVSSLLRLHWYPYFHIADLTDIPTIYVQDGPASLPLFARLYWYCHPRWSVWFNPFVLLVQSFYWICSTWFRLVNTRRFSTLTSELLPAMPTRLTQIRGFLTGGFTEWLCTDVQHVTNVK